MANMGINVPSLDPTLILRHKINQLFLFLHDSCEMVRRFLTWGTLGGGGSSRKPLDMLLSYKPEN